MKLLFLCGSLEPGRDGVGDYTRRLAAELIRQGHGCGIIALNDHALSGSLATSQESDGVGVPVLRLAGTEDWELRIQQAREWKNNFVPDWVSFQFVPFAFHPKGLPFFLGRKLQQIIGSTPAHMMFHEIWLGVGEVASPKHRLWGWLQRIIILDLLRKISPARIHTQAEPYRRVLVNTTRREIALLPLFSNIRRFPMEEKSASVLKEALQKQLVGVSAGEGFYLAVIFGAVHPGWDGRSIAEILQPLVRQEKLRLVFAFLGKSNISEEGFSALSNELRDLAGLICLGEQSPESVSMILQSVDMGLSTTPLALIQKSAATAVMLEHGLTVLVSRDDWRLRGQKEKDKLTEPGLITVEQLKQFPRLPRRNPNLGILGIESAGRQLIEALALKK